jgi:hypothetical protein
VALLDPERFLKLYADGLEKFGYWDSPLERMAYAVQAEFRRSKHTFDGVNRWIAKEDSVHLSKSHERARSSFLVIC